MTLEFVPVTYDMLDILSIVLLGATNLTLVIWSISLRRDSLTKHSDIVIVVACSLLIWSVAQYLLPDVNVTDWTWDELKLGFSYDFTREVSVRCGLTVILGLVFFLHGKDNRGQSWTVISVGGLLLVIDQILLAYNYGVVYYLLWFSNPQGVEYYNTLYQPIYLVLFGLMIASLTLVLLYAIRNRKPLLVGYVSMFLGINIYLTGLHVEMLTGLVSGLGIGAFLLFLTMRITSPSKTMEVFA